MFMQCSCTSRRCATCLNGVRTGGRTTRHSGRCAWRTTGLGTKFVGHYGWTHRKVIVWLPTMRRLFKARASSVQVCQSSSAIPSTGGKNAMKLHVATATAAKCLVDPMQQCGVTRHHTPSRVRVPCQVVHRPPVHDFHGSKSNMPTPVSHIALSQILSGYDKNVVQFIINGFSRALTKHISATSRYRQGRVRNYRHIVKQSTDHETIDIS